MSTAPYWCPQSEWDALPRYVADVAIFLRLRDWQFVIDFGGATSGECTAYVNAIEGRKLARLFLSTKWADFETSDKRHCIVHELIHCHFAGAAEMIRIDTVKHLAQSTYDVLWAGFIRHLEYGVDGLADVLAPMAPVYPE